MFTTRIGTPWICRSCRKSLVTAIALQRRTVRTTVPRRQASEELPPGLILRAQKMALRHKELEEKVAAMTDYTPQSVLMYKRISQLSEVSENLKSFEETLKNIRELEGIISSSNDNEMISLAKDELQQTSKDLNSLKTKLISSLVPRHPQAHLPCIMEFKRGVGGDDAAIFALDLYKMYSKYANQRGWKWDVLSYTSLDSAADGIVDSTVLVSSPRAGDEVYGTLRTEAGVHRVQRVPVTETQGRMHTSAAAILIFPQVESSGDPETSDQILNMSEVKIEVMRARGAGGQHVNKTESAVRMTHVPTGITVSMQDSRSQHQNREAAIMILRSRVAARKEEEKKEEARRLRNMQVTSNDRSDKIRTWNFSQNRVTDHRGFKYNDLRSCMEGNALGEVMEGVAKVMQQQELEEAIAMDAVE